MRTLSFVGSDKNAGKTTVFNFVAFELRRTLAKNSPLILTSIGINGELWDNLETAPKPAIRVDVGDYFVTADRQLTLHHGKYAILTSFPPPDTLKTFVLARALVPFNIVLEGPNEKDSLLKVKAQIKKYFPKGLLLLDGSIDRQFIGHPDVSDAFYFVLIITDRAQQVQKAQDLVRPLTFEICPVGIKKIILKNAGPGTKCLLGNKKGEIFYKGTEVPAIDERLRDAVIKSKSSETFLYLNGSFSRTFSNFLGPMAGLTLILDNFTLYQDISVEKAAQTGPSRILLLHPVMVEKIFIKQETERTPLEIPVRFPTQNLFREEPYEIGIGTKHRS